MTYGADLLHEEVSYLAYHLHWSFDDLLDLEHDDRTTWQLQGRSGTNLF